MLTREPTYNHYGVKIRRLLREGKKPEDNAEKFLKLFVKDRKEHLKLMSAFDGIVICDRHKYSTFAYQQAQGLAFDEIFRAHQDMILPDIVIILDVPAEIAMKRMAKKASKEIFDKHQDFLEKVRNNYLKLPGQLKDPIVVLDGTGDRKEVAEQIWKKVKNLLH
jgi:dTMP kinase